MAGLGRVRGQQGRCNQRLGCRICQLRIEAYVPTLALMPQGWERNGSGRRRTIFPRKWKSVCGFSARSRKRASPCVKIRRAPPLSSTWRHILAHIARKKIPPQVIRDAKGICIYTSMKSALAPFGGMNGTGLLLGRLPDGSWSPPSCICPNYYSAGFVIGLDIVDVRMRLTNARSS